MANQVGFISPNNERIMMDYDEVNNFCKRLCENYVDSDDYKDFCDNYSYFDPYFDYVMVKLGYVFINPFLTDNSYLKAVNNKMFKIENDDSNITYDEICSMALTKNNASSYSEIVVSSDSELNLCRPTSDALDNWLIDPNGYALISYADEKLGNHEITANTVLNNLLIRTSDLYKKINLEKYSVISLIENFGFLRTTSYGVGDNLIIGARELLSSNVSGLLDSYIEKGAIFHEWSGEFDIDLDKFCDYSISDENTKLK